MVPKLTSPVKIISAVTPWPSAVTPIIAPLMFLT